MTSGTEVTEGIFLPSFMGLLDIVSSRRVQSIPQEALTNAQKFVEFLSSR